MLAAAITAEGAILVAAITVIIPLLVSNRRHAKVGAERATIAAEQLANDHEPNFRVENDQRHAENVGRLGSLETAVKGLHYSVRKIEDHLGIEETTPPPPRPIRKARS